MKALVGAFNHEKALVGAFSVIVKPVVEPMDRFAALHRSHTGHINCSKHSPARPAGDFNFMRVIILKYVLQ